MQSGLLIFNEDNRKKLSIIIVITVDIRRLNSDIIPTITFDHVAISVIGLNFNLEKKIPFRLLIVALLACHNEVPLGDKLCNNDDVT